MLTNVFLIGLIGTSQVLKEVNTLYKVANGVPGLIVVNTTIIRIWGWRYHIILPFFIVYNMVFGASAIMWVRVEAGDYV